MLVKLNKETIKKRTISDRMQTANNQQQQYRTRINQFIRVPQIRVILNDSTNAGVMNTYEALKLAKEQGFDFPPTEEQLVEFKLRYL
jgi:spore coat protein CotF